MRPPPDAGERPQLSVVIPAFNEESVLPRTLALLDEFLADSQPLRTEVLVVDDGSEDGTAACAQGALGARGFVVRLPRNMGKGAAVREGVLRTRGDVVMITDADGNYLHNRSGPYLAALSNADIVLASRAHPASSWDVSPAARRYMRRRRLMGRVFSRLVDLVAGVRLTDTQTGLKFLRGPQARQLFADMATDGFAFDVELLCRALRRGMRVAELPLVYTCESCSTKVGRLDPLRMFVDLFRIRFLCRGERLRRGPAR